MGVYMLFRLVLRLDLVPHHHNLMSSYIFLSED
ncbi:hypothetical protein U732_4173 [Clostridium argentinense CDC 2741]|uniref:Uncharacterized protein n=1 Tax=Clostridium argentinense CDC 2741 TaxID=1418104 RepID=A0A0C1UMG0_9CLOT|nr:hypothetical protein U732_4173 [Clostridium argentinense CDC 2741]